MVKAGIDARIGTVDRFSASAPIVSPRRTPPVLLHPARTVSKSLCIWRRIRSESVVKETSTNRYTTDGGPGCTSREQPASMAQDAASINHCRFIACLPSLDLPRANLWLAVLHRRADRILPLLRRQLECAISFGLPPKYPESSPPKGLRSR